MKSKFAITMLVAIFSVLTVGFADAVDDSYIVELNLPNTTVLSTGPIYVQWIVKNSGANSIPLYEQISPTQSVPRITYRLWIEGSTVSKTVSGSLDPIPTKFTVILPHSTMSLWEMDLRNVFSGQLSATLPVGLYRISVEGSWKGAANFWAQAYFVVKDSLP